MNNGDGLRVVLWLSGCSHRCKGCQNPQTWNVDSGILFDKESEEELFRELNKDYISGLTLTGGDPLHENNLDKVLNLVDEIRLSLPNKNIWLYSGYTYESIMNLDDEISIKRQAILKQCDVLIDGRYVEELRDLSLKYRGSSNQRVIDVKKTLEQNEIVLYCD